MAKYILVINEQLPNDSCPWEITFYGPIPHDGTERLRISTDVLGGNVGAVIFRAQIEGCVKCVDAEGVLRVIAWPCEISIRKTQEI